MINSKQIKLSTDVMPSVHSMSVQTDRQTGVVHEPNDPNDSYICTRAKIQVAKSQQKPDMSCCIDF